MTNTDDANALDKNNDSHVDLGAQPPNKQTNAFPRAQNGRAGRTRNVKKEAAPKNTGTSNSDDLRDISPPTPVPEPNEAQHIDKIQSMQAEIDIIDKRMVEITAEIQKTKEFRASQGSGVQKLKAELNDFRPKIQSMMKQRDELAEQSKKMSEALKEQETKVAKMRKALRFGSEEDINSAINQLSKRLESSSLDLKTEKELLKEMQSLHKDKETVRAWLDEGEKLKQLSSTAAAVSQQRQVKIDELNQLREREKPLVKRLEATLNGEGQGEAHKANALITTLLDDKALLAEQARTKRAALQAVTVSFKIAQAEYREYKLVQAAYDRKLERLEFQRRRAAAAAAAEAAAEERRRQEAARKEERRRLEQRMQAVAQGCQLFVGGLAIRCEEAPLQSYFGQFGKVTDCYVVRDGDTRLSRGFGFVTLSDDVSATAAIKGAQGAEVQQLCPPHGRLSVKKAEKSKLQLDFEARRASAARPPSSKDSRKGKQHVAVGNSAAVAGPQVALTASAEEGPLAGGGEAQQAADQERARDKGRGTCTAEGPTLVPAGSQSHEPSPAPEISHDSPSPAPEHPPPSPAPAPLEPLDTTAPAPPPAATRSKGKRREAALERPSAGSAGGDKWRDEGEQVAAPPPECGGGGAEAA